MRRRGLWRFAIALLLLIPAVGGAAWFVWLERDDARLQEVAVFRADTAPYRMAPETADVSDIPNTGILVLETTASGEEEEEHEVLMPPPEEPFVLDTGTPEAGDEVVDVTEAPLESADEGAVPEPIFDADQVTAMVDEALDDTASPAPPLPGDKPATPAVDWVPGDATGDEASGSGSLSFSDVAASLGGESAGEPEAGSETRYGARIASYSSEEMATTSWDRLHREHNDLFAGLEAVITTITLDGNHFFRLTIGEFEAKEDAEGLCASVVERALECRVVSH